MMENITSEVTAPERSKSVWDEDCFVFVFWFYSMFMGTLCIIGILGNTLSFLVLRREKANKVALFLLMSLALADNLFLFISLFGLSFLYGILKLIVDDSVYVAVGAFNYKFIEPFAYASNTATVWITVLLALNR